MSRPKGRTRVIRGHLGEVIKPVPGRSAVAWMLGWRCRKCGHVWPMRMRRDHQEKLRDVLEGEPGAGGVELWGELRKRLFRDIASYRPKKCSACDAVDWWKPYSLGPQKGPRMPRKLSGWRARFGEKKGAEVVVDKGTRLLCTSCGSSDIERTGPEEVECGRCGARTDFWEAAKAGERA